MAAEDPPDAAIPSLFERLREANAGDWRAYTEHEFVRRLADGTLPEGAFRHYLAQDYLFLIHFARAYGLAVYKSETLADMRGAAAAISAILDVEIGLHVHYCAGWGLDEAALAAAPEDPATTAYTDYVLETGLRGDLLDLQVALAPCVVGYGEIGARLAADPATVIEGNPYREWIAMYAGADYQEVAEAARIQLDELFARRGGPDRAAALEAIFGEATRLETDFWAMGLAAG
jgi:thiaminase/transcriptional activator TenA